TSGDPATPLSVGDPAVAATTTRGEAPPAAVLAEVLGPAARYADPAEQARYLVDKLAHRRCIRLKLGTEGTIQPVPNPGVQPPDAAEQAVIEWLAPAIVAELRKSELKSTPGS